MLAAPSTPARLRASTDIAAVFAARSSRAGRLAVVHHRRRDDDTTRVAVVASRRVGNAVQRNRAKRLLREAARVVAWRPGHDVVLTARAAAAASGAREVTEDVLASATRLGLVHEGSS